MIEVANVTKNFPAAGGEVHAVRDVNLMVSEGEFVIILGRSGSGKSTLLGMLAGLIRPSGGTIRIRGRDIGELDDTAIAALRAQEIGFVFQFSGLIPTVTALRT